MDYGHGGLDWGFFGNRNLATIRDSFSPWPASWALNRRSTRTALCLGSWLARIPCIKNIDGGMTSGIFRPMDHFEQAEHMGREIDKVIDRIKNEYDMSYEQVIGVLQLKVAEICSEAMDAARDNSRPSPDFPAD